MSSLLGAFDWSYNNSLKITVHGLFHPRYFENRPLERPEYMLTELKGTNLRSIWKSWRPIASPIGSDRIGPLRPVVRKMDKGIYGGIHPKDE